jgi:primosomal protein N'
MVSLTVTSQSEKDVTEGAKKLSESLIGKLNGAYSDLPFTVFGPFEAEVYKLNEKYRMKMAVKCRLSSRVRALFGELLTEFSLDRKVTLTVDLNPLGI